MESIDLYGKSKKKKLNPYSPEISTINILVFILPGEERGEGQLMGRGLRGTSYYV